MTQALEKVDRTVAGGARRLTRRRLVRRASEAALAFTFTAAYLGRRPDLARGNHDGCGGRHCRSTRCDSTGCNCGVSGTRRRAHNQNHCVSCLDSHCWNNGCYRCCDCCVNYDTYDSRCSFCPFPAWRCTCSIYRC